MKAKIIKTLKYFGSYLLPLAWIMGFAAAMTERNEYVKTNLLIYLGIRFALVFIFARAVGDMRLREIKGLYCFVSTLAALIIAVLSMWLHFII